MASECCFSRTFAKAAALVEAWLLEETHKCRLPQHSVQYWMWKAKAGHQTQNSALISLSLEAWTSNSTTALPLHFLTLCTRTKLDAHSKTFVHKLFSCNNRRSGHRPVPRCEQKWSCHTVTQTKASQEDVYAPGTTPSLLADLVLGRRRLLGHSRSSGESTDHKHGGHTNHCGHILRGRKKKRKRNCHDSGHWSKLCSLQSIQLRSLLQRWDVGNANLRFGKDPIWNF